MIKNIVISKIASATPAVEPVSQPSPSRPPSPVDSWTKDQWDTLYADLRNLQGLCGDANSDDQLFVLVNACLENDINTIGWIISVLRPLGFEGAHVGAFINGSVGRWCRKDKLGVLSLMPATSD